MFDTLLIPVDTGRKLNVQETFRRRPGHLLIVLYMANLRLVSTGIITLFLQALLLVCLPTLRLSINIKHLSLFSFITDINGFFEIPNPPPPLQKNLFNKNLQLSCLF